MAIDKAAWSHPPHPPKIALKSFAVHIPQPLIDDLHRRLEDHTDIPTTYENSFTDGNLGVEKGWVEEALQVWRSDYDW